MPRAKRSAPSVSRKLQSVRLFALGTLLFALIALPFIARTSAAEDNSQSSVLSTRYFPREDVYTRIRLKTGTANPFAPLLAYTWNPTSGSNSWTLTTNWTPNGLPGAGDSVSFSLGGTPTVTNVPIGITMSQISVGGGTQVTFQAGSAGTLTLDGGINCLDIALGASLNIDTANGLTINISSANSSTARVLGSMTLSGGLHRLTATSASGITFHSGSSFTQGTGISDVFGTSGASNTVIFASGSTFTQQGGNNPFGLTQPASKVVFQTGSLFRVTASLALSFSGRVYGNFEFNPGSGSQSPVGTSAVSIDNLTVSSGTLNVNVTGTPGHAIKGNISVASGATLTFSPGAAGTINLNGTGTQLISGAGALTINSTATISVSNGTGVTLQRNVATSGPFNVVSGGVFNTGTFILSGSGTFNLQPGGSLSIGHADGITVGFPFNGNIQTTSTKIFNAAANYTYNGTAAQVTGNGLPTTLTGALTISNSSGVTLSQSTTLSGASSIASGATLNTGAFALTVNNTFANGGTFNVSNGGTLKGTGTVTGPTTVASGGTVAPGVSPGILNTGNISFTSGSVFQPEINGTTVGTDYDQLNVTGTVALGGATLDVVLGFAPTAGNTFTIINNDDTDAVTGTFAGLGQGATFTESGTTFQISYVGGDGNDVVLTAQAPVVLKYRSKQSGNWTDFNTWETSPDGTTWTAATSGQTPTSADDTITIQSGHTVILNGSLTVDQVTVDGLLAVALGTLTNNGPMTVNGTFQLNEQGIVSGTALTYGANGTLSYNGAGTNQTTSNIEFPSSSGPNNLIIGAGTGTTVFLDFDRTINGTLNLLAGPFSIGAHTLSLNGPIALNGGSLTGGATSNISFGGSGASTTLPAVSGGLNTLTINRANGIALGGAVSVSGTLNLTSGTLTNGANLTLGDLATINRASTASIMGTPTFANRVFLSYTGGGDYTTGPELPTSASAVRDFVTTNPTPFTLTLGGNLTVNNVFLVNGGSINTGTNTLTLSGGTNQIGSGNVTVGSSGTFNLNNSLTFLASGVGIVVNGTLSQPLGAVLSGAGTLTVNSGGTATLGAANTYTGATSVSGTLVVNGSTAAGSAVSVNSGGTLKGTGTVSGPTTVASGGTVAPGVSPGIMNSGSVTFTSGSNFDVEINGTTVGTQYDQLNVTGTVNLGGATLNVTLGFTPTAGDAFTIINNDDTDAISGTFAGLPQNGTLNVSGTTFAISYTGGTGNDVVLTAITPPDVSITDASQAEGNGPGTTTMSFTVTRSGDLSATTTVNYSTTAGTATQGSCGTAGNDYESATGMLTFAPSDASETITVTICGDTTAEPDETFTVKLATPSNATISDDEATGTITNDDSGSVIYTWTPNANQALACALFLPNSWICPANWNPVRPGAALANTTDILIFDGDITPAPTIVNVPTQTVAAMQFRDLINQAKFEATLGAATLTVNGDTGSDLSIALGSALHLQGANPITIALTAGGQEGLISGNLSFEGAAHKLTGANAGQIVFQSTSIFTTTTGFIGHPFGSGMDGSVVFAGGSQSFFGAGDDPWGGAGKNIVSFGLVPMSSQHFSASSAFDSDGRTYGNLTLTGSSQAYSGSGSNPLVVFGDFVLGSTSTLTLSGSAGGDMVVNGNWTDNNASLTAFNANGRTVTFSGGNATQTISKNSNPETFFDLVISKTGASVNLLSPIVVNGQMQFGGTGTDILNLNTTGLTLNGTLGAVPNASSGFLGDLNGAALSITGSGALGNPIHFVVGGEFLTDLSLDRAAGASIDTDLTIGQFSGPPVGSLNLTNGILDMGTKTLTLNPNVSNGRTNGYVSGNLKRAFVATGPFTFHVGTANGYSPVSANVTGNTFPSSLTVKAVQGQHPNITGANALQRYWTLTGTGDLVADVAFNWLAGDVVGAEANYKIFKYDGSFEQIEPDALNTVGHFAIKNGVSSFSDWTLAEAAAVEEGTLQFSAANFNDNETNADHLATITVSRTGGTDGAVSVQWATSANTATVVTDYVEGSGTLNWADGEGGDKTFTVAVKGDTDFEPDELVNLTLSAPTGGATIGAPNPATLTIQNDDVPPCTPPSTVYVDDDWAAVTLGADPDAGGPATQFGCDSFATIQGGVDGVTDPGTVIVNAGTYTETVTVNKQLSIRGAQFGVDARTRVAVPESIVNGPGGSFILTANGIALDGFTVQGANTTTAAGIVTDVAASGYQIRNNIIKDNRIGLYLRSSGATQALVEKNLIRDNNLTGGTSFGNGLFSNGVSNALIENNLFAGMTPTSAPIPLSQRALHLAASSSVLIKTNAFADGNGVWLSNVDGSEFSGNTLTGSQPVGGTNVAGLSIQDGTDNLLVSQNTFTNRGNVAAISSGGTTVSNLNVTITLNTVTHDVTASTGQRIVMGFNRFGGTSNITENTITLTGALPAGAKIHGMDVSGSTGLVGTVNILRNTINGGNTDVVNATDASVGVVISPSGLGGTPGATINVNNNFINGWINGVSTDATGFGTAALLSTTTVAVTGNDLSGNANKNVVAHSSGPVFNASANWHGSAVFATVQSKITGTTVDYTPYLNAGTDTAGTAGYQGDFSSLTVHASGNQFGTTARIQEGIGLVTSGGTVKVLTGTYTGNVDATSKSVILAAGASPGQVTVNGNFTLDSDDTLPIEIDGTSAATQYDNFIVNGSVTLGNATLVVSGTYTPAAADSFTIINNDTNADAVVGTFNGLPEGTLVNVNGRNKKLTYAGGDGNDVVLAPLNADLSVSKTDSPDPVTEGNTLTYTLAVINAGPDAASDVVLTDTLPGSVTFVSATPSQGSPCTGATTITCNLGTISNGGNATVQIVVIPNTPGTITNNVTATAFENDATPATDSEDTLVNAAVCTAPAAGMVAWYPGEGNANDIQGPPFENGTPVNGATFASGKVNNGFVFDGLDDHVSTSDYADLSTAGDEITIDAWIKRNSTGATHYIASKWNANPLETGWYFGIDSSDRFNFGVTLNGVYANWNSTATFTDTATFHHVAVTFEAGNAASIKVYVDGVDTPGSWTGNGNQVPGDTSWPVVIGALLCNNCGGPTAPVFGVFDGVVDEVEVFNTALSGTDIANIYNASFAGKCHANTIQFSSATYSEAENVVGGNATITVTRAGAVDGTATVDYATIAGGSANAGTGNCNAPADYQSVSNTLSFAAYETSKTFTVPICDENIYEADETVNLELSNATGTGASLGTPITATLTIQNDDPVPSISIDNVTTFEGDSGTTDFNFTVTLSNPSYLTITVTAETANGTATTADADYNGAGPTVLTFAPGTTTQPFQVQVNGDTKYEHDETFVVNLSLPSNATIADGSGTGTITNDDAAPAISINDLTLTEGQNPPTTKSFTFTVTKSGTTAQQATVNYQTANDTGGTNPATSGPDCSTPGVDYIASSGVVTFPASGPGSTSQTVTILVCRDNVFETNETFLVNLSGQVDATIADGQAVGTINNDDVPSGGFVVNTTADTIDDNLCLPVGTGNGCTLREAINAANASPSATSINFAIPANDARHFYYKDDGVPNQVTHDVTHVIVTTAANDAALPADKDPDWPHSWWSILPASALPTVTQQTAVDGYSQPGATANTSATSSNAVLRIELEGSSAGAAVTGLVVSNGLSIVRGLVINRFTSHGLQSSGAVTGNFIGTDVSGTLDLGNTESGVLGGNSMTIGGNTPELANVLSGNDNHGVLLTNFNSVIVQGNYIGTKADGVSALGNSGNGIHLTGGTAVFNTIGGADPGEANIIAFNGNDGVALPDAGIGNRVRGNSIFSNGTTVAHLGIDLGPVDGVTANDVAPDSDTGPNALQNFPVIQSAVVGSPNLIAGTLNSAANQTFTIDLYSNPACDASGNGEGKTYLGSTTTTTDSNGLGGWRFSPATLNLSDQITATATSVASNTSEFSLCFTPRAFAAGQLQFAQTSISDAETNAGSHTVTFTVQRTGGTDRAASVNYTINDGTATTADNDYSVSSATGTLQWPNGDATDRTITITVNGDTKFETDETVQVVLSSPVGASINGPATATLTITNEDTQPAISISDVTLSEGNAGTTAFNFTVSLSNQSYQTITVNAQTADDTATTADSDYTGVGSTPITFNPGETSKPFQVLVNGDTKFELNDQFFVNLSGETNATISDAQGVGTITNDDTQPTISIDNVTVNEGHSGTTAFNFTVSLSNQSYQTITVNAQTADDTATTADSDYTGVGSTLITFNPGETSKPFQVLVNGDTTGELNETFSVLLSSPTAATIGDGTGVGTITNDDESAAAGQLIISEFRLSGPGANATARANNEFIELYNATDQDLLVTTTDGSAGWAVATSSGVEVFLIPNGTRIPARGHFLGTNITGYSLKDYGGTDAALGDATWTTDVADNTALAVFRTNNPANFNTTNRLDSVGPNTEPPGLYKEGAGYSPLVQADLDQNLEHTFFRLICAFQAGCPTPGRPRDTQDNAADFIFADTTSDSTSAGQRLGGPGPENLASPIKRDPAVNLVLLDATVAESSIPINRDRNTTQDPSNASSFGTMTIRRRVVNQTGVNITRLRFRVIDMTTHPSGVYADLRLRSSSTQSISGVNDPNTCASTGTPTTPTCTVNVMGLTLEQPPNQEFPNQVPANGGGLNSTVTLASPLPAGQSVNVNFLLGVQKTGQFRFYIVIEALP